MATFDPPWRLDPLKNIVGVGWRGGANILLLHFAVNVSVHEPYPITVQPSALDLVSNVFDNTIHQHDAHLPIPVIASPTINAAMIAHSYLWNRAPLKPGLGVDLRYMWKAVLFLNLAKIKTLPAVVRPETYDVVVAFPASEKKPVTGIILYAFTTFGVEDDWEAAKASAPHPISDVQFVLDGPHTLVGNILTFGNPAERAQFLALNGEWFSHDEPATGDTFDLLDWEVKAYTYKGRKTFPLKADTLEPDYPVDEKQISFQVQHDHATFDVQIPARTVTFTVNLKTLTMTSLKV
jgi:hypothetical protein